MEITFTPEYPNIKKTIDNEEWITYITSKCNFTEEAFFSVMDQWCKDPQNVTPPILRAEILNEDKTKIEKENSTIIKQIKRKIVPRQDRDPIINQNIQFIKNDSGECRVIHSPDFNDIVKEPKDLPFFFPQLKYFSYNFIPTPVNSNSEDKNEYPKISLEIVPFEKDYEITDRIKYIFTRLLRELFKHCRGTMNGYKKRVYHDVLVPKIDYQDTYKIIKNKYGNLWVKQWPEDTDPKKHVYEDIGIATWLKLLWKEENDKKKVSFVDIGCGNGLLTNILTKEEFNGYGIDISKRKIWDLYDKDVKLIEKYIYPHNQIFKNGDWIIGNHPDEMTLWIPIMAARSGYDSKFIIIPCCCYELSGAKYVAKGPETKKLGKYGCFLNRVREVIKNCGYVVEEDNLRIPSTKSVAFVGRKRTYERDDKETHEKILKRINEKIDELAEDGKFHFRIPDKEKQQMLMEKRLKRRNHSTPDDGGNEGSTTNHDGTDRPSTNTDKEDNPNKKFKNNS